MTIRRIPSPSVLAVASRASVEVEWNGRALQAPEGETIAAAIDLGRLSAFAQRDAQKTQ